jgi:hypothetical protein
VLLVVCACCGFVTWASGRRWQRVQATGLFDSATVISGLRRSGIDFLQELPLRRESRELLLDAFHHGKRRFVAASNETLMDVRAQLEHGALLAKLAWRICLAATGAGVLCVVWTEKWMALAIAGVGVCAALGCAVLGRSADLRSASARGAWNALIRTLLESFSTQGEKGETA